MTGTRTFLLQIPAKGAPFIDVNDFSEAETLGEGEVVMALYQLGDASEARRRIMAFPDIQVFCNDNFILTLRFMEDKGFSMSSDKKYLTAHYQVVGWHGR